MKSVILFFILLNPFLLSIYLLSLIRKLDLKTFASVLLHGSFISMAVFALFAYLGESLFDEILQVRYGSFLIFGGIIFLITSIRLTFGGVENMYEWRGKPEHMAGAVAMPFMIGPATVSASILIGQQMSLPKAFGSIVIVLLVTSLLVILFKVLHDFMEQKNERLVERYIEVIGRIMTLYVGAVSVDMILRGLELWLKKIL